MMMSEAKYNMLIGFLFMFDTFICMLILVGFWPNMTKGLMDGTYPYWDNVRFVIAGSAFGGLLGSIGASFLYAIDHPEW